MTKYDPSAFSKIPADAARVLDLAETSLGRLAELDERLGELSKAAKTPTDANVYRVVIGPWLRSAQDLTRAALHEFTMQVWQGKPVDYKTMISGFERTDAALEKLNLGLQGGGQTQASDDCTYEAGWAGASIVFGVGACAVSLGLGCIGSAVFAVKALDDATEACQ